MIIELSVVSSSNADLVYKRTRFSTRLPADLSYTKSHFWLGRDGEDRWHVGFTKFALRFLGEPVEFDFEIAEGELASVGQIIGWVEGFKAVTDIFCPMAGRFGGANPELSDNVALLQSDPYRRGWLYAIEGEPGDDCIDARGYVNVLDATIDKMTGKTA